MQKEQKKAKEPKKNKKQKKAVQPKIPKKCKHNFQWLHHGHLCPVCSKCGKIIHPWEYIIKWFQAWFRCKK